MENGQGAESNGMDRFVWSMVGGENLPKKFHEERMKSEKKYSCSARSEGRGPRLSDRDLKETRSRC